MGELETDEHGDHADDCPASLAAYRDAIAELTERIEALSAKRAALAAQLHHAAYRTSGAPACDDERKMMTDLNQLPQTCPCPRTMVPPTISLGDRRRS
jgi:hypothetical protein